MKVLEATMPLDLADRFVDKFRVAADGCWIWDAATDGSGRYGAISVAGGWLGRAHRVAYELYVGPIPKGLVLDHLCRNTLCVNPAHLEPVTQQENVMRGTSKQAQNATKTHCPRGHAYDMVMSNGGRWCRTCHREASRLAQRRYRARKRAEAEQSATDVADAPTTALHNSIGAETSS